MIEVGPILEVVTGYRWERVEIVFAYRVTGGVAALSSEIVELRGFSPEFLPEVRADQRGLIDWYGAISGSGNGSHPPLALVHGEDKAREAMAGEIGERYGVTATLARPGTVLQV